MASKQKPKPIEKRLFYEDGRQRAAHIGLRDSRGVMLYMTDTCQVGRFEYAPFTDLLMDAEADKARAESDLKYAMSLIDELVLLVNRSIGVANDIISEGKFEKGRTGPLKVRVMALRNKLKEIVELENGLKEE